jgi:hypothetical protein
MGLISTIEFKLNSSQPSIQSLFPIPPHVIDLSHWIQTKTIPTIDPTFPPKQRSLPLISSIHFKWNHLNPPFLLSPQAKHIPWNILFNPNLGILDLSHPFLMRSSHPSTFTTCQIVWKPREAPFDPSHPIHTISSQPSITFSPPPQALEYSLANSFSLFYAMWGDTILPLLNYPIYTLNPW